MAIKYSDIVFLQLSGAARARQLIKICRYREGKPADVPALRDMARRFDSEDFALSFSN